MKARPRVVLITRRFWPLIGGAERFMAELGAGLVGRGCPVTLLTARLDPSWPNCIQFRGFPVVRLPNPNVRFWGTLRYMQALISRLRRHAGEYDIVYTAMLKHDAWAAIRAVSRTHPVVLFAPGSGPTGDCAWQETALLGTHIRRVCRRADAVTAPSPQVFEELVAAGYPPDRLHLLPHGIVVRAKRTPGDRNLARDALGRIQPQLRLADSDVMSVYVGRLHPGKGLLELVEAWETVVRRHSHAFLWLVGEGPLEQELRHAIRARNLQHRVMLPGAFDDVRDFLLAADCFVFPSHQEGMPLAILEAMEAALPIVATDIPGNRLLIRPDREGMLVPVRSPDALSRAVSRLLEEPELAQSLAAGARARVEAEFGFEKVLDAHLDLFSRLLDRRRISAA
ncbi:glycosyltransferase family 4 protein [Thermopirellula anaerolimosa]